jgi:hypothetical protein
MLAAEISSDRAQQIINETNAQFVWIGTINSPTSITFSGDV